MIVVCENGEQFADGVLPQLVCQVLTHSMRVESKGATEQPCLIPCEAWKVRLSAS